MSIKWSQPQSHIMSINVTSEHIDEFQHVNNAWYIVWAMECGWAHSKALGLDFAAYEKLGVGFVVRHHDYTYLASAVEGDKIAVGTRIILNDGKLRLKRSFEMYHKESGRLLVRGETEFVSMGLKSKKATRMPPAFQIYSAD